MPAVSLRLLRSLQEPLRSMVRHVDLREPRQEPRPLPAPTPVMTRPGLTGLCRSGLRWGRLSHRRDDVLQRGDHRHELMVGTPPERVLGDIAMTISGGRQDVQARLARRRQRLVVALHEQAEMGLEDGEEALRDLGYLLMLTGADHAATSARVQAGGVVGER